MEQTLESKLNLLNANKNEIPVRNYNISIIYKLFKLITFFFKNDNSQILSIHERLEKLEKAYDAAHNVKLQK